MNSLLEDVRYGLRSRGGRRVLRWRSNLRCY